MATPKLHTLCIDMALHGQHREASIAVLHVFDRQLVMKMVINCCITCGGNVTTK